MLELKIFLGEFLIIREQLPDTVSDVVAASLLLGYEFIKCIYNVIL